MTNMGCLIPSPSRTPKDIFKEKIHGTEKYLVSAELIAYLKWLIYVAAFKDRGNVNHVRFYNNDNKRWKGSSTMRSMPGTPSSSHPRNAREGPAAAQGLMQLILMAAAGLWFSGDREGLVTSQ